MTTTMPPEPAVELLSRVRQVWPEPVTLTTTRGPRQAAGTSYVVLPSLRRPVLLVPADSPAAATAILRVDEGQRTRIGSRVLAWAHRHGVLRRLPLSRVEVGDPDASPGIAAVRAAVPEAATIAVRLGRARHGRTVVLQALDVDGGPVAFGKCGSGPRAADLEREHDTLTSLGPRPACGVRAPRVLALDHAGDQVVLVLEALVPSHPAARSGAPVAAMRSLAERGGTGLTLVCDLPVVTRLRADVTALAGGDTRDWLRRELDRFVAELGIETVRVGCWHGDWVAWNMVHDAEEVLLWDWEHQETGVPLGFDHIHYLAQDLRSRRGTSAAVEDRWLADATTALRHHWGVVGPAASATIRAYLLAVNVRYARERADLVGAPQRMGWARSLVERLPGPGP